MAFLLGVLCLPCFSYFGVLPQSLQGFGLKPLQAFPRKPLQGLSGEPLQGFGLDEEMPSVSSASSPF